LQAAGIFLGLEMTSYWKPRWPHRVVFGSYRELSYRLDLLPEEGGKLCLTTNSGPGFALIVARADHAAGWQIVGEPPSAAQSLWLAHPPSCQALSDLLRHHFSRLAIRPDAIQGWCRPGCNDLFPEGAQLGWCLELIHRLWERAPLSSRQWMSWSEFVEGREKKG
jgi:hypothetical protein